jgi:segregation and condensation protein B
MARKKKNQQSDTNDHSSEGKSPDVSSLVANASAALEALMGNTNTQMPQTIEEEPEAPAEIAEAGDDYGLETAGSEPASTEESSAELLVSEAEVAGNADSDGEEISDELAEFGTTGIFTEEEPESFLPEATEEQLEASELESVESVEGTELDAFESAQIEEVEFVEDEQLDSIIESVLFASDRPVSLASLKLVFKGTNVKGDKIRRALDRLAVELASGHRGVSLEEVPGGYQLRTKIDNMQFLTRTLKARQFKLSGPALEVLAIVAYKQPLIKHEIDEIRGVESGHLLRALMEKGLVNFEGKSDLPGKPMLYATTKKFLEIFGLRNLKELPTLSQIDELLPEGMTEEEAKPTLSQVTDSMSTVIGSSYSEGEEELTKITDQLININTSSEFFEQEKVRQRQKRDADKAQNIREAMAMNEEVTTRDRNWLIKYDEALLNGNMDQFTKQDQAEETQAIVASEVKLEADLSSEDSTEIAFEEEADGSDEEPTGEAQL